MGRFDDIGRDIAALRRGDRRGFIVDEVRLRRVPDFTPAEIKAIRHAAGMPQNLFAQCIGVSQKTVEAWEGGRSHPDGAARRLLGLLKDAPDFFARNGIFVRERSSGAAPVSRVGRIGELPRCRPAGTLA